MEFRRGSGWCWVFSVIRLSNPAGPALCYQLFTPCRAIEFLTKLTTRRSFRSVVRGTVERRGGRQAGIAALHSHRPACPILPYNTAVKKTQVLLNREVFSIFVNFSWMAFIKVPVRLAQTDADISPQNNFHIMYFMFVPKPRPAAGLLLFEVATSVGVRHRCGGGIPISAGRAAPVRAREIRNTLHNPIIVRWWSEASPTAISKARIFKSA